MSRKVLTRALFASTPAALGLLLACSQQAACTSSGAPKALCDAQRAACL